MKLLINASNLYVGGGVQVAISVIEEMTSLSIDFIAAVSPPVYTQLSSDAKSQSYLIIGSPSGIFNFSSRQKLNKLVASNKITHVFTVFGPSYWTPKNIKHLVGFALPWLIYDTTEVYKKVSLKIKIKMKMLEYIQPYFYKKNANAIVCETEDAKERISTLLKTKNISFFTVKNTVSSIFSNKGTFDYSVSNKITYQKSDILLLTISHDYPHKNLQVISALLDLLPNIYKFVLTVDSSFLNRIREDMRHRIIPLGSVMNNQCPPLYERCDAMFLPTFLECFSASYPEAFYCGKPVITSDRGFAHTVCGDAAAYFDPLDPNSIASAIRRVFADGKYKDTLVNNGKIRLDLLPSSRDRAIEYIEILRSL